MSEEVAHPVTGSTTTEDAEKLMFKVCKFCETGLEL